MNLYTYCQNSPIIYTDPSGHIAIPYITFEDTTPVVPYPKYNKTKNKGLLETIDTEIKSTFNTVFTKTVNAIKKNTVTVIVGVTITVGAITSSSKDKQKTTEETGNTKEDSKTKDKTVTGKDCDKVADSYLEENGVDAHDLKKDVLGKKAPISKYDIYVNKSTGELYVFLKGGKGVGKPTGVYIK